MVLESRLCPESCSKATEGGQGLEDRAVPACTALATRMLTQLPPETSGLYTEGNPGSLQGLGLRVRSISAIQGPALWLHLLGDG